MCSGCLSRKRRLWNRLRQSEHVPKTPGRMPVSPWRGHSSKWSHPMHCLKKGELRCPEIDKPAWCRTPRQPVHQVRFSGGLFVTRHLSPALEIRLGRRARFHKSSPDITTFQIIHIRFFILSESCLSECLTLPKDLAILTHSKFPPPRYLPPCPLTTNFFPRHPHPDRSLSLLLHPICFAG